MLIADWLSQLSVIGLRFPTPNSSRSRTTHVTSAAAEAIALNSAAELDRETMLYFFDFHEIGEFPRSKM